MRLGTTITLFDSCGEENFKRMKEFGFDYIDIRISGDLAGKTEEEYERQLFQQKEFAEAAGITISQAHGPWRYPPHDETEELRAERSEIMKRGIRIAGKLGCQYWVVHPLMPFGVFDDFNSEQLREINYHFFCDLLPVAKENGVTICLENMPFLKFPMSTPEKILEMIHMINDDHFKFCLDTGHCAVFGIQPADAVLLAKEDLKVMHVHDNSGNRDEHMLPYMGIIDWPSYCKALKEIGFGGVFSFESSWKNFLPSAPDSVRLECLKAIAKSMADMIN